MCCAGIGRDGKWRRQYPVPFRILYEYQKFRRWDWISYGFSEPDNDRRKESQKVIPETLTVTGSLKKSERARFINPLVRSSFSEADELGESLTLLRPQRLELVFKEKSDSELESERQKHADLANQLSLFDNTAKPLEPCPMRITARWIDMDGNPHRQECDDWETSSAFNRFDRDYGRESAIDTLKKRFEDEFLEKGLVMAFSTHSRRNVTYQKENQWLLVGLIRLDPDPQGDLLL